MKKLAARCARISFFNEKTEAVEKRAASCNLPHVVLEFRFSMETQIGEKTEPNELFRNQIV